jgi:hypothetical protein
MTRAISGRPARCLANRFTALGAGVPAGDVPDYRSALASHPDEGREMRFEGRGEQSAFGGEPEMQRAMRSACQEIQSAFGANLSEHREMHSAFGGKLSVFRACRSKLQAMLYAFGLSLSALRRMLSVFRLYLCSFRSRLSAFVATSSEEQAQRYEGRAIRCPNLAMRSPNLAMLWPYLAMRSLFAKILCEGAAPIREQSRGHRALRPMPPSSHEGRCRLVEMQSERPATPRACLGVHSLKLAMPCVSLGVHSLDLGMPSAWVGTPEVPMTAIVRPPSCMAASWAVASMPAARRTTMRTTTGSVREAQMPFKAMRLLSNTATTSRFPPSAVT